MQHMFHMLGNSVLISCFSNVEMPKYASNGVLIENNGRISMDTGVMKGGVFPDEFREQLAANHLARWLVLSLKEDTLFPFSRLEEVESFF